MLEFLFLFLFKKRRSLSKNSNKDKFFRTFKRKINKRRRCARISVIQNESRSINTEREFTHHMSHLVIYARIYSVYYTSNYPDCVCESQNELPKIQIKSLN